MSLSCPYPDCHFSALENNSLHCPKCGRPVLLCEGCKTELNQVLSKYCRSCGHELKDTLEWKQYKGNQEHNGLYPFIIPLDPQKENTPVWKRNINENVYAPLLVYRGLVLVFTANGNVLLLDQNTGKELKRRTVTDKSLFYGACVDGPNVWIPCENQILVLHLGAILLGIEDQKNQKALRQLQLNADDGEICGHLTLDTFSGREGGITFIFAVAYHKEKNQSTIIQFGFHNGGFTSPKRQKIQGKALTSVVVDNYLLTITWEGTIHQYRLLDFVSCATYQGTPTSLDPAAKGGKFYYYAEDGGLYALDVQGKAKSPQFINKFTGATNNYALGNRDLVIGTPNGLHCFGITGASQYRPEINAEPVTTNPIITKEIFGAGLSNGRFRLHSFRNPDMYRDLIVQANDRLIVGPAVQKSNLYLVSESGTIGCW